MKQQEIDVVENARYAAKNGTHWEQSDMDKFDQLMFDLQAVQDTLYRRIKPSFESEYPRDNNKGPFSPF